MYNCDGVMVCTPQKEFHTWWSSMKSTRENEYKEVPVLMNIIIVHKACTALHALFGKKGEDSVAQKD